MNVIALALKKEMFFPANDPVFNPSVIPQKTEGVTAVILSDREHEIMELVVKGKSNKEIGTDLGISPYTAKNHVQRILSKLGAKNRTEAANLYIPPRVEIFRRGKK